MKCHDLIHMLIFDGHVTEYYRVAFFKINDDGDVERDETIPTPPVKSKQKTGSKRKRSRLREGLAQLLAPSQNISTCPVILLLFFHTLQLLPIQIAAHLSICYRDN